MTITLTTEPWVPGFGPDDCVCTAERYGTIEGECGDRAVVLLLDDGEWLGGALCAKHSHPAYGVVQ